MKSFKKIASLFLALCMAVSVFTVPSSAAAGSVKEAIIIGSTGDPVVKVLLDIPEDLENIVGVQFILTAPEKFTIKSVESSIEGWEFNTNSIGNSATVIMDDGKGATDSALFLENVATASFEGLYELATVEMTPADDVVAGDYEISVVVEDIAVYDPASGTEDGIVNNENSEAVIRTFEYAAHTHEWGEGVVTTPASCTTDGVKTFTCGTCGERKTEVIPSKGGHKEVTLAAKAPTCTATGFTAGKQCSVCKVVTVKQNVLNKKAHVSNAGVVTKKATYDATGIKTYSCTVCKQVLKTEVIAKLAKTSLKKAKFTVKDKTYTGKALTQSFTVKLGSKTLKNKVDYTISYKNNKNIGKATVTIKGIGAYKDSVSKTFAINPKKVSSLKLKAGKKQMTVSWKKDSKVGGYEIVYATSKNFKKAKKTVKISKASTAKKVISKLKSKKTYYVKVRSFKKVGKTTYYGAYTSVKSVKVK